MTWNVWYCSVSFGMVHRTMLIFPCDSTLLCSLNNRDAHKSGHKTLSSSFFSSSVQFYWIETQNGRNTCIEYTHDSDSNIFKNNWRISQKLTVYSHLPFDSAPPEAHIVIIIYHSNAYRLNFCWYTLISCLFNGIKFNSSLTLNNRWCYVCQSKYSLLGFVVRQKTMCMVQVVCCVDVWMPSYIVY